MSDPQDQTNGDHDLLNDEEMDFGPFLNYLQTEKGHEALQRVLSMFEDIKKVTLDKTAAQVKFEKMFQLLGVSFVIIATSILTYCDKFEASLGVLFGSIVGYLFGRK